MIHDRIARDIKFPMAHNYLPLISRLLALPLSCADLFALTRRNLQLLTATPRARASSPSSFRPAAVKNVARM